MTFKKGAKRKTMKKLLLLLIIVFLFSSCETWTCSTCLETQYSSTKYIPNRNTGYQDCISVEYPRLDETHLPRIFYCKDCCRKKIEHLE